MRNVSRRHFLLGGAGALSTGMSGACTQGTEDGPTGEVIAFRGEHQSGILSPAQQQIIMVAFDMVADRRKDLIDLLSKWTIAAERMQAGQPVNDPKVNDNVPPDDTGEAMGLTASNLTITFGFGRTLFQHDTYGDRFGIAQRMPMVLANGIPRMAAEYLDKDKSDGDLVIQICAEDPMVVLHAMHQFKRIAFGTVSVKWMQLGYGRTSSTSTEQETPRNLFGFKDGTANIKAEDNTQELAKHLWIQPTDDAHWAAGAPIYACVKSA